MIKKKAIFNNLFSNHTITPQRLCEFGQYTCNLLTTSSKKENYTALVTEMKTVLEALQNEDENVTTNLADQVNTTRKVETFIDTFIEFMKDNEPFIARALGGRKTADYRQFYPLTIAEYDNANKTSMKSLTSRLRLAAGQYKEVLGEPLAGNLQSFEAGYKALRNAQLMLRVAVHLHRNKRNELFTEAQWVLTAAVHYVAFINRSDEEASRNYFRFDMLYPKTKRKIKRLKGALDVLVTGELPHFTLITTASITIKNVCANAHLLVWIANREDGIAVPASPMVVKALSTKKLTADMLKDMGGKRVLVKNSSATNPALYDITITGLKKIKAIEMDAEPEEETIEEENQPMVEAS